MVNVYILSAGVQRRFPDNYMPKQLLLIDNESVLARQVRQLASYNLKPIIITKNELIQEQCKSLSVEVHDPARNETILQSIASVRKTWLDVDRTIYLLGDVFYSHDLFKNIIENDQEIRFWMSGSEIFAFSLKQSFAKTLWYSMGRVAEAKIVNPQIWHIYRHLNKINIHKHKIVKHEMVGDLVVDYTFDIDSLTQYNDVSNYVQILKQTNPNV